MPANIAHMIIVHNFSKRQKNRFLRIVSDADLSSPLEQKVFAKAYNELAKKSAGGEKYKPVFEDA